MIDAQEVLRPYASPQLREVIDRGIELSMAHKQQAENLIKELGVHAAASQTEGAAPRREREDG
jgi:hypothetical protein